MNTDDLGPGLHILVDGKPHKLAYPEIITWTGNAWVSLSDIAIWSEDKWHMIDLNDKGEDVLQAAFAMAGSSSIAPMIPPPQQQK